MSRPGGSRWSRPQTLPAGAWNLLGCATRNFCLATDGADPASGTVVWNGTRWHPGPTAPMRVDVLSCVPTGVCVAGGTGPAISRFDGTTWTTPEVIDPNNASPQVTITVLSCPTNGFCVAQDSHARGEESHVITFVYRHGVWGRPQGKEELDRLSCASPTLCVGHLQGRPGTFKKYDGSRWRPEFGVGPFGYSSVGTAGLSCAGEGFCVTVDDNGHAFVRH